MYAIRSYYGLFFQYFFRWLLIVKQIIRTSDFQHSERHIIPVIIDLMKSDSIFRRFDIIRPPVV